MLNPSVLSGSIPAITIWRKYYYAGANRVAMQVSGDPIASQNGVFYLLSDHLGSSSVTVKATDEGLTKVAELRYKPWGENRYSGYSETATPTDRRFTGQRLEQELGIYHYGARWYDPMTGRFLSPDTIVPDPGNPIDSTATPIPEIILCGTLIRQVTNLAQISVVLGVLQPSKFSR